MERQISIETPIGLLYVTLVGGYVVRISALRCDSVPMSLVDECGLCKIVATRINEYMCGCRRVFDFPIAYTVGSDFKHRVWNELRRIPYGETLSYGEVATRIGSPGASRVVGMACNGNPLLLAVPCHRVIGADGSLTGFACGIDKKQFLLELEAKSSGCGIFLK